MVDLNVSTRCFADATRLVAVAVVITVAAGTSIFPADRSLALVVAAVATVGAMDGRAACSVPKSPASCSFSLRFSLRACDFEYGARDASKPVCGVAHPPPPHPHPYIIRVRWVDNSMCVTYPIATCAWPKKI